MQRVLPSIAFAIAVVSFSQSPFAQIATTTTVQQAFDVPPNAGSFADLRVACPAGYSALSGGLDSNASAEIELTTLAPTFAGTPLFEQPNGPRTAGDGWQARVINYGAAPRPVMLSVVCAPAVDIIVSIDDGQVAAVDGHAAGVARALPLCFDGYVALGGGIDVSNQAAMKLTVSAPLFPSVAFLDSMPAGSNAAPVGWHGKASNQGPAAEGSIKAAAICARVDGATTEVSSPVAVPFGSHRSAAASCPTGTIATGGGMLSDSPYSLIVTSSTPTMAGHVRPVDRSAGATGAPTGWFADMFSHESSGESPMRVGAICVPVGERTAGSAMTVYEFYNSILKHYFRTSSSGEADDIDGGSAGPGWQRTGDNFVALAPGFGAIGNDVCRFYTFGANSHFYTAFADECESLKAPSSGWVYESTAYRIQLPSAGNCPAATEPVHRLYNNRFAFNDSNHRFTTQFANVAPLEAQGWIYEGVAFCALNYSGG